jgi:hypothetical protein
VVAVSVFVLKCMYIKLCIKSMWLIIHLMRKTVCSGMYQGSNFNVHLEYFMDMTFYDHLVHFFPVLVSCTKKNLATLACMCPTCHLRKCTNSLPSCKILPSCYGLPKKIDGAIISRRKYHVGKRRFLLSDAQP